MSRTILVVGNCQIGGIAGALQWLFPGDVIKPIPYNPHVYKGDAEALARQIGAADVVVGGEFVSSFLKEKNALPSRFVTIPSLYFSAFHPDIVAARSKSTGARHAMRYNSAIVLWSYANRVDPADTVSLFSKRTFKALGYFARWEASAVRMKAAFDSAGLDFNRVFLAAKRDGIFMHTVNHPKTCLLVWVAKMLATHMGGGDAVWRRDVQINDALGRVEIWPVYPAIANELALPGSYTWFVDRGQYLDGLREYVDFAYTKYEKSGVPPADLQMMGVEQDVYHRVLSAELKGT